MNYLETAKNVVANQKAVEVLKELEWSGNPVHYSPAPGGPTSARLTRFIRVCPCCNGMKPENARALAEELEFDCERAGGHYADCKLNAVLNPKPD